MAPSIAHDSGPVLDRFKILIVASLRYPIAEPFAGGLEAHTYALARGLQARGHSVTVAAAAGSDPEMVGHVFGALPRSGPGERADIMEIFNAQGLAALLFRRITTTMKMIDSSLMYLNRGSL